MSQETLLADVRAALESAGIPYMITGSLASSFHGTPRSTRDIDIVIAPDRNQLLKLVRTFDVSRYYISEDAAVEALDKGGLFNLIDSVSGWKLDFIIRKNDDFGRQAFARRTREDILGAQMYLISAEDSILSKLDWAKQTESERQIEDVAGILLSRGSNLDFAYLHLWIHQLGLGKEWKKARTSAES